MSAPNVGLEGSLGGVLRIVGVSHVVLGFAHIVLWRLFDWSREITRLTPLTARVFAAHTFFIAFVVTALGALALGRPDLLVQRSELARLLVGAALVFWLIRLIMQPTVFDPVLLVGSPWRTPLRVAATSLFALYVCVYAWALAGQFG